MDLNYDCHSYRTQHAKNIVESSPPRVLQTPHIIGHHKCSKAQTLGASLIPNSVRCNGKACKLPYARNIV